MILIGNLFAYCAAWCWMVLACYFLRRERSYAALFFTLLAGMTLIFISVQSLASAIVGIRELIR